MPVEWVSMNGTSLFVVDGLPDFTAVPEPEQGGDAGFTGL